MKKFILGSHNSWSYLRPKRWWMWPFAFMARCQRYDIKTQYEKYGVRCFDLRIRFVDGMLDVRHGIVAYNSPYANLRRSLEYLNDKKDVYVRVLNEARTKEQHDDYSIEKFRCQCKLWEMAFPNIKFWCGRNLYDWHKDYEFENYPSCEEKYCSVCKPRIIDDWWPWLYARLHNKKILREGTSEDILLIDFVDIR